MQWNVEYRARERAQDMPRKFIAFRPSSTTFAKKPNDLPKQTGEAHRNKIAVRRAGFIVDSECGRAHVAHACANRGWPTGSANVTNTVRASTGSLIHRAVYECHYYFAVSGCISFH